MTSQRGTTQQSRRVESSPNRNETTRFLVTIPFEAESINQQVTFSAGMVDLNRYKHKWEDIAYFYLHEAIEDGKLPFPLLDLAKPIAIYPPKRGKDKEEDDDGKVEIVRIQENMIKITTTIYFRVIRERDKSNYSLVHKAIEDAMVRIGLIPDDSQEFIDFGGIYLKVDAEGPRIEILLEKTHAKAVNQ